MLSLILVMLSFAGEPVDDYNVDETIVVEARKNMVVYVEDPIVVNASEKLAEDFNSDSIVGYVNSHARFGKVKNERGTYDPVTMHTDRIEVYDSKTIEYAYSECDYGKDPIACAIQNDHYTVRTNISINDREIVVRMTLYDSSALIVSTSSRTSREIVEWIRQQEVNVTTQSQPQGVQQIAGAQNCTGNSCPTVAQTQQLTTQTTTVNIPKEEPPLRFSIPPNLLDRHLYQASIGLFTGVKLD